MLKMLNEIITYSWLTRLETGSVLVLEKWLFSVGFNFNLNDNFHRSLA